MKSTLLFATLSMALALPCKSAQTELESLKQRCQQQEQKIARLESQLKQLGVTQEAQTLAAARSSESAQPATNHTYTVKAGDNIEKIARRSGCSAASLYKINGLKPTSIIYPDQRIKLPTKSQTAATDTQNQASKTASASHEKPAASTRTHTIKQGETYSSISRQYRIPVNTLVALNPGIKATALRPGINIRLGSASPTPAAKSEPTLAATKSETKSLPAPRSTPISAPRKPVAPAEASAPEPTRTKEEIPAVAASQPPKSAATPPPSTKAPDAAAQPEPNSRTERKIRSVKIEEPMTYGQFASKHGTDSDRLNDLNGLDLTQATVLAKGSELYVPAQP